MPDKNKKAAHSNNEVTSQRVAKLASAILRDPQSSRIMKSIAGAALTQTPNKKRK